jgi:hypothetical protein
MSCSQPGAGDRKGLLAKQMMGSTLLYNLAVDEVFLATCPVGAFDEYVLTDEDFERMGPSIVDIVVHAEGSNFSSNFSYDLVVQFKFGLGAWQTGGNLIPLRTNGDYTPGTPFTNRAQFGIRTRILLRTQITGIVTATQRGNLNITAAVRMYRG